MPIPPVLRRLAPKRPIDEYHKTWLGAIALAVIVVVVAAVLIIGRMNLGKTEYTAQFAQAATVGPGDRVTIAGISVGTVTGLRLAGDHVDIRFTVNDDVHLGRDSTAAIKLTTLLGSRYIQLVPRGAGELPHHTIAATNTSVPYDLQKTLADSTTTFEQVDADHIADSLGALSQNLDGVPEALPHAMTNLRSLAAVITTRRDQLGSLLANTDTLTTLIHNQQANIGSLMVQGRNLLRELTSRREALRALLSDTTALVHTLDSVLDDAPAVTDLVASLHTLTKMIADHDALLRNILQTAPIAVRNLANATGSGTALDLNLPAGPLIDSWMCAISGRAQQFHLVEYFQDCQ